MQQKAKRDRLYLEQDADLAPLQGKLIASLGYGSQGHAQAQNLRDSGLEVIVGNVEDRYAEAARGDGFEVVSIPAAVQRAGRIIDGEVRDSMRRMLRRVQSGELVREWNLEQLAGRPVLTQLRRELAEHDIRHVEGLFLERKRATGW